MALAISPPKVTERSAEATAALWTSISAGVALVVTIPLVAILAGPVSDVLFVRGTPRDGSWGYATLLLMVLLAPATYAMFFVTAGEMLKERVELVVHKRTTRFAAAAFVPYMVLVIAAVLWSSGPQLPMLVTASFTVPVAMVTTIWVSRQSQGH